MEITIKCQDCNRTTEVEEDMHTDSLTCRECGGYFDQVEDESDSYDDDDDDEDEDLDEEEEIETPCRKDMVDLPSLNEEVSAAKFDPEAKTKFD